MPDRVAAGICDFGVIDDAGNTVRVINILGGVQVVHGAFERSVAVAARGQISGGIQVYFGERDIAEDAVVLHGVDIGVHGVGILVAGNTCRIGGIGLIRIATAKCNCDDALTGVDERAAAVGRGDVGVIIRVAQPNRLTV